MEYFLLGLGGLAAGALGGLLGIGGGILIMPLLRFAWGLEPVYAAGTCIVAVFFTTLGGSLRHHRLGHINFTALWPVILAGLISTMVFSLAFSLASHQEYWLDVMTGAVFFLVALRMLFEGMAEQRGSLPESSRLAQGLKGSLVAKLGLGAVGGALPGLLGIGTGAVLVPGFALALNAPIKMAIGSSLACFSLNALVSGVFKASQGYVVLWLLPSLCVGTFLGSQIGAWLNGRFSAPWLKILFGALFLFVAFKYIMLL